MAQTRFLSVANFDATHLYKDRSPIWIKLSCSILDDYDFSGLSDDAKFHAIGLMILAARLNNKFPDDEVWLRRKIGANSMLNLKNLIEIGFLVVVKGSRSSAEKSFNACKPNKLNAEFVEQPENEIQVALPRTEQNRTDENRREHTTTDETQNGRAAADAKNVVVVGEFSKSSQTENRSENEEVFNKSASAGKETARGSRFTIDECLKYARASDGVKNPNALANSLFQTGNADAFIMAMLYPHDSKKEEAKIYGQPVNFKSEPCAVCFGAKMADADGKGYRKCVHCKDERGTSTGFEPKGETE